MIVILTEVERKGNVYIVNVDVPPFRPIISSVNDFHEVVPHVQWLVSKLGIHDRFDIAVRRTDLKG